MEATCQDKILEKIVQKNYPKLCKKKLAFILKVCYYIITGNTEAAELPEEIVGNGKM